GMKLTPSAVKQFAQQHGIPLLQPVSLKTPDIQIQLKQLNADVMVVAAYGLILPQAVLTIPQYGCLNIHAS
ncbi:MAG TPA: formyltransferase family protein, partial [Nitrosomonas sp.]|nr:formyltransferase family protein [Nitrosomonas sp.]